MKSISAIQLHNKPELIVDEILLPNSVFFEISFLKKSPVESWNKLNFFEINLDWVPLPAPGGPKIITFILSYIIFQTYFFLSVIHTESSLA